MAALSHVKSGPYFPGKVSCPSSPSYTFETRVAPNEWQKSCLVFDTLELASEFLGRYIFLAFEDGDILEVRLALV